MVCGNQINVNTETDKDNEVILRIFVSSFLRVYKTAKLRKLRKLLFFTFLWGYTRELKGTFIAFYTNRVTNMYQT